MVTFKCLIRCLFRWNPIDFHWKLKWLMHVGSFGMQAYTIITNSWSKDDSLCLFCSFKQDNFYCPGDLEHWITVKFRDALKDLVIMQCWYVRPVSIPMIMGKLKSWAINPETRLHGPNFGWNTVIIDIYWARLHGARKSLYITKPVIQIQFSPIRTLSIYFSPVTLTFWLVVDAWKHLRHPLLALSPLPYPQSSLPSDLFWPFLLPDRTQERQIYILNPLGNVMNLWIFMPLPKNQYHVEILHAVCRAT